MAEVAAAVATLLAGARARLKAAGVDAPWLSALVLLEHATGRGREAFLAHPDLQPAPAQVAAFRRFVERRCAREPLAYILEFREFYGRRFQVTPATLIPRPETETLVDLALRYMQGVGTAWPLRLLDVGTGCGAIAITLLAQKPGWTALATDVDGQALLVARHNAQAHGVESRHNLVACDLAAAVNTRFPLVVANLPYIASSAFDRLQPEIARYEPRHALDGGPEGTSIIEACLRSLPAVLAPGGTALFEIGEDQGDRLTTVAGRAMPGSSTWVEPDAAGAKRFLVVGTR